MFEMLSMRPLTLLTCIRLQAQFETHWLFPICATEDMESTKCHLGGIIVRDLSPLVSNYRSVLTLDEYLKKEGVVGESLLSTPGYQHFLCVP